jgi:hypothetical protein
MTAVEWLENQMKTSKHFYKLMEDISYKNTVAQSNIFDQAKEMEKGQMMDAYRFGISDEYVIGAEQYYNKTFKQQSVTDDTL